MPSFDDPIQYVQNNVIGAEVVLEAARQVGNLESVV